MTTKIITHRCQELLDKNNDYTNGHKTSIYYGYRFDIVKQRNEDLGWWIQSLERDGYESSYMKSITKIKFCPFCGIELGIPNAKKEEYV